MQFFPPARLSVLDSDAFVASNSRVTPEDMQTTVRNAIANGAVLSAHPQFPTIALTGAPFLDQVWQPDANVEQLLQTYCDAVAQYFEE
ncbi:MAG: hypothetical protein HC915_01655 [Anaerolineae bacterium]|nr:hypothetical protein [Anaerolineae bacterium]